MPIASQRVLYDDQWLLAVTKLSGELVVKGKGRVDRLPLLDFLRKQYPALFPIHRLDFETSGVVCFAKSRNVLKAIIASKFAGWKKLYQAIVLGTPRPPVGTVDMPLPARTGKSVVPSSTSYKVLKVLRGCSLVELSFDRGRKHQIRRHLSMIGCPLILDDVYGNRKANKAFHTALKLRRFFLHASSVEFLHPVTGKTVSIESPLPAVFESVVGKLSM